MKKNIDYVVISELPESIREQFEEWLIGKTRPIIEEEGDNQLNCAYKWDYDRWIERSKAMFKDRLVKGNTKENDRTKGRQTSPPPPKKKKIADVEPGWWKPGLKPYLKD